MLINGPALQAIRERSGLTQSDLARLTGISQGRISGSNPASARRAVRPATVKTLAEALAVPTTALILPEAAVRLVSEHARWGRIGAHESWARTTDRAARTAPARRAALERFEREVDPDGALPPAERTRRAEHARKAHMQRLAMKSAAARKKAS